MILQYKHVHHEEKGMDGEEKYLCKRNGFNKPKVKANNIIIMCPIS